MYSDAKADKLIKEFAYLIGMPYYPFGEKGRVFKIESLKRINTNGTTTDMWQEVSRASGFSNPIYFDIVVSIGDGTDMFTLTLVETLQALNIRHDIDKIPD